MQPQSMRETIIASPEAELPRVEDAVTTDQAFAAGYTPTETGRWATALALKAQ